jgi:hypothetical protein
MKNNNNKMYQLLLIDAILQTLAFISAFLVVVSGIEASILYSYFIVGIYQLISALVFIEIPEVIQKRKRYYSQLKAHGVIWSLILISFVVGQFYPPIAGIALIGLFIELVLSPFTAMEYYYCTWSELKASYKIIKMTDHV